MRQRLLTSAMRWQIWTWRVVGKPVFPLFGGCAKKGKNKKRNHGALRECVFAQTPRDTPVFPPLHTIGHLFVFECQDHWASWHRLESLILSCHCFCILSLFCSVAYHYAGIVVPYLHVTESPFSTVNGAYESLEYTIARGVFPLLVLGTIYLTAITVGRVFCGWACPFGLVQVRLPVGFLAFIK